MKLRAKHETRRLCHALLVDMGDDGPIDDGIYTFITEERVLNFAANLLIDFGFATIVNGRYWSSDMQECYGDRDEMIGAYQDGLERLSYFHPRTVRTLVIPIHVSNDPATGKELL